MQKDLEKQLCEETKKNLLCGGLSREIYQSLSVIRNASGYLTKQIKRSVPQECSQKLDWAFEHINQSTLRLNRVAENLEDMLAAERGILTPRNEWLDLVWQYRRVTELMQAGSEAYQVRICWHCDLSQNKFFVFADCDWADKILINLLSNAVLCSSCGQTVTVTLDKQQDCFVLVISDQGPGLPQNVQEHLFEAFVNQYQTEAPPSGAGLGLYLANSYAKMLGWQLAIESTQQGTTASVTIPIKDVDWQQITLKSNAINLGLDTQKQRVQAELSMWQAQKQFVTQ